MFNIDPFSITVSGFSAGGFMAAQLGIAYSSIFSGFGVFAGGPYDCARDQDFLDMCLGNHTPAIDSPSANIRAWSSEGKIDSTAHLRASRVFLQAGRLDEVVGLAVTRQLEKQLLPFVTEERMTFVELENAAHVFPTDFDSPDLLGNPCSESVTPYIANCGYDGVGEMLKWLYNGDILPLNTEEPTGKLHEYNQAGSLGAVGLANHGYYYVPSECNKSMTLRRLHVALHGCTMSYSHIGLAFIEDTGYLQYADTNNMVKLFPQAGQDNTSRPIWHNGTVYPGGSLACFDWVGWSGEDADWRGGKQMQAIVNMAELLIGRDCPSGSLADFELFGLP